MAPVQRSDTGQSPSGQTPSTEDRDEFNGQGKKKPKQQLSCAECRRLKLKCTREIPCSNCLRRGCRELCPDGSKETRRPGLDTQSAERLQSRLVVLENFISEHGYEIASSGETIQRRLPRRGVKHSQSSSSSPARGRLIYDDGIQSSTYDPTTISYHMNRRSRSPSRRPTLDDRERKRSRRPRSTSANHPCERPIDSPPDLELSPPQNHEITQLPPTSSFGTNTFTAGSRVKQSHGTLVMDNSGRSRYLGPTAGTEWLKNQEMEGMKTHSQAGPPVDSTTPFRGRPLIPKTYTDSLYHFPFNEPTLPSDVETLCARLPPKSEAEVLVNSYYRYFAWNHDPAPRRTFMPTFNHVYHTTHLPHPETSVHLQRLALVYIILAMGTIHNIEIPPHDESAEEYLALSRACMTKGDFMSHGTIAGVQTLMTMAHYYLETENGRNGDSAWPLWGLAMSLIVAMGLHRDGARWNLPEDIVQERRQVFWECHTIEIFQANCFSRPNSLGPNYIDTELPSPNASEIEIGGKGWPTLKFELCKVSAKVLDAGMTVGFQAYDTIQSIYSQLCRFETEVPFELRCQTALLALPSVYPDPEMARRNSPDVSRHDLHRTLQQFTLALNISENVLFLQRPYFVMAMHDEPADPTRSIYGHSYLAVVERCNVIIQVVADMYKLHPTITSRHWFFWYHLFTAAVCLGTLILKTPQSTLSSFALSQIDQAIRVYAVFIKQNDSPSMLQNHDWLVRLYQRAAKKIAQVVGFGLSESSDVKGQEEEDRELLGWKTRLIERAASGAHTAVNIPQNPQRRNHSSSPVIRVDAQEGMTPTTTLLQQHLVPPSQATPSSGMPAQTMELDYSTDLLLHQFWDPMMMPDGGNSMASANWWSWEFGAAEDGATSSSVLLSSPATLDPRGSQINRN